MAISDGDFGLILHLKRQGHIRAGGAVVEIGAQQLNNHFLRNGDLLKDLAGEFGVAGLPDLPRVGRSVVDAAGMELLPPDAPLARAVWEWLGFTYAAIDIDGSPDSIPLDLNFDGVPEVARAKFHLVTNYGTTEHIANQLNAFRAIHDLTAPGGAMLHNLPAQGYVGHGLFNYNPKFFWLLAHSNRYHWRYFDYQQAAAEFPIPPDVLAFRARYRDDHAALEGRSLKNGSIIAVLEKTSDAPFVPPLDIPLQGDAPTEAMRRNYWSVFDGNALAKRLGATLPRGPQASLRQRIKRALRRMGPQQRSHD